jgi:hypothetical protein
LPSSVFTLEVSVYLPNQGCDVHVLACSATEQGTGCVCQCVQLLNKGQDVCVNMFSCWYE